MPVPPHGRGAAPRRKKRKHIVLRASAWQDADGSGGLDKGEVAQAFKAMGREINAKELDEIFGRMDADGGGEVEFEEFEEYFKGARGPGQRWFWLRFC